MCVHGQSSCVLEVWPHLCADLRRSVFVIVAGYIDESYSGENPPLTFGLNCVLAAGSEWFWIENAWNKVLARKNKELEAQGRRKISRYHSVDLSNFAGDFKDWDGPERTDFTDRLLQHAIRGNWLLSVGFTANLKEIAEAWPRVMREGVIEFGYHAMLRYIMLKLVKYVPVAYGVGTEIILIHDRCPYDGVLLSAFNHFLKKRPEFASLFRSIAPMGWQNCVPLQPADFVAYEAMKETHRTRPGLRYRDRRLSLKAFLDIDTVGADCMEIPTAKVLEWKEQVEEKDRARGKAYLNDPPAV